MSFHHRMSICDVIFVISVEIIKLEMVAMVFIVKKGILLTFAGNKAQM